MKIPNAILQMAYLKLFILLSMLTSSSLIKIWANDGLKYHKIPFGNSAGKQSLDESIFPPEDSLLESLFLQAYCNWLSIIDLISSPEVTVSWHEHHSKMLQDQKISLSFDAWQDMDRQLHMQFVEDPFIIDPTCTMYSQLFKCTWMDAFLACTDCLQGGECPFHAQGSFHSGHKDANQNTFQSSWFHPYKDPEWPKHGKSFRKTRKSTLFLHCRSTGHWAGTCVASQANRPECPIICDWKNNQLVSKSNKSICIISMSRVPEPNTHPPPMAPTPCAETTTTPPVTAQETDLTSILYKVRSPYVLEAWRLTLDHTGLTHSFPNLVHDLTYGTLIRNPPSSNLHIHST